MRLFIAINLPDQQVRDLKRALYRLASYDLPVRWLAEESLHITLQFLGEVSDARLPSVQAALEQSLAGLAQFDVEIGGLGAFPSLRRPNIFWIGVAESPELSALHRRVDEAMAGLGFPSEERPFTPHITLGRVHKDGRAIDRKVVDRMVAEFDYKSGFRADGVDLMRSRLGPRGARHELIERMELP